MKNMAYWKGKNQSSPTKLIGGSFSWAKPALAGGGLKNLFGMFSRGGGRKNAINQKIDEKVEEKVDDVVNQDTNEGLE